MSLRSLTPDLYGTKKNTDLPIFNKFTPKKHSNRILIKRIFYTLVLVLLTYTIYSNVIVGDSPKLPSLSKSDIEDNLEREVELQRQQQEEDLLNNDHQEFKVTKDGVQEVTDPMEITTDDLKRNNVEYFDLNDYQGSSDGNSKGDVVLFLMPLRNAEHVLPMAFYNLMNLTYDHSLIDIAFLVSDCSPDDTTLETVFRYSMALQNGTLVDLLKEEEQQQNGAQVKGSNDLYQSYMEPSYMENVKKAYSNPETHHKNYRTPFRSVTIFKKDFGQVIGQGFSDRHAVKVQGIRRKLMGRARNWLTSSALKADHSWVYWRDVDIETCPGNVIEELMSHDYDVMVPNVWRPLPTFLGNEQPYDLNSWIESDAALELAKTLAEDDVIVEGYAEYPTWRAHLAYIRDPNGNPREVVDLDGVGGVSILARAKIFRQGVHFPAFTFLNHAETEAFGKMAKKMGFRVGGLPHYTIWHIYEPSEDDLQKISKLERSRRRKAKHS
ncbi:Van1 mannosyltransferase [Candida orthopsilosis Co 90-125]|uniref:Van1 mannosyltransferase n=1 Tax=Candida orthopsilosis (strain 90-125) TaxID=1136231 RepID=H8X2F3_CANO9|nr:Van1 mannosyltransferase [Candida orthopsilosis Co 90-125]CCG25500.1 Van1 mannosyltransferase [Candida orthopsilosis Co 90-125]